MTSNRETSKETSAVETAQTSNGRSAAVVAFEEKHGIDLRAANKALEKAGAEERVTWAIEHFQPRLAMSSSFGAQAAATLHLAVSQWPEIPVILIDTGYLFPETYNFIDELTERLNLNLKVYGPSISSAWQEARYGKQWEHGLKGIETYNQRNKVDPMNRALEELDADALIAGLRRSQSSSREGLTPLAVKDGRLKIHPIVDWSDKDVYDYLKKHGLPYHPLWHEGYLSIGDWHTSHKLTDDMTPDEARFFGLKRECGLHENTDYVI